MKEFIFQNLFDNYGLLKNWNAIKGFSTSDPSFNSKSYFFRSISSRVPKIFGSGNIGIFVVWLVFVWFCLWFSLFSYGASYGVRKVAEYGSQEQKATLRKCFNDNIDLIGLLDEKSIMQSCQIKHEKEKLLSDIDIRVK